MQKTPLQWVIFIQCTLLEAIMKTLKKVTNLTASMTLTSRLPMTKEQIGMNKGNFSGGNK